MEIATSGSAAGGGVPAVRRAAAILWLLAEQAKPLNLSEVARRTGILPSTALQILRELGAARLIAIDADRKLYSLGQGLIDLARSASRPDPFAELARPHLQDIATRFDVTAMATAAVDDRHTACVAAVTPPDAMSLNVTLGGRVPILSGAAGRCVAAYSTASPAELRRSFNRIRWQRPLRFEEWMSEVETVRREGFAEDGGVFALGVTTLAAPVFAADGSVTRAIGVATISAALDEQTRTDVASALMNAARRVSEALGYTPVMVTG